ncbi:hypothetical protein RQP46_011049 [Phenoliferia psychrophenolica]
MFLPSSTLYVGVTKASLLSSGNPVQSYADLLADNAIAALASQGTLGFGVDLLKAVKDAAEGGDESCRAFWEQAIEGPEMGRGGKEGREDRIAEEWKMIREGQDVFWRYSTQIFSALMHFSLAGGFSSPNLSAVLRETGYLTSSSRDATYKRLLETTLFVIDAMKDLTPETGRGWQSALRVRLLHAQVRHKILHGKGREKTYDVAINGVPINQADLALVLGSFMIAPIWSMKRTGLFISEREQKAYQAVWTHIGFFLGLSPSVIDHCYSSSSPFSSSEVAFASLAFTAFPLSTPVYTPSTTTSTYKILLSGIKMGKEVGVDVKWRWKLLLGELVAVVVTGVALVGVGTVVVVRAAMDRI